MNHQDEDQDAGSAHAVEPKLDEAKSSVGVALTLSIVGVAILVLATSFLG